MGRGVNTRVDAATPRNPISPTIVREAITVLEQTAKDRKTVAVAKLPRSLWLLAPGDRFALGRFRYTGVQVVLTPDVPVVVRQAGVSVDRVMGYIDQAATNGTLPAVMISRGNDGHWWHLDGLHRLVASRLLQIHQQAQVWTLDG
jgi:hypothetical protein